MASEGPSREQELEVERLLASANLHRMRGELMYAEERCREALGVSPEDVAIRETLGDILHERGKLDAALSEYRDAVELAPGSSSLETKLAKVALEIAERERQRAVAQGILESPHGYTRRERSPVTAVLLAIVPGLGQFYNGDLVKALVIWGVLVLFLASWRLQRPYPGSIKHVRELLYYTNPLILVLGVLFVIVYLYGLIDAAITAERLSKAAKASKK
ncbi:MAG TPA: hypothetical protein VMX94_10780 [Armatimonadota bacterium]|nr:hypothetical protein [Armatimonadota bacterium]